MTNETQVKPYTAEDLDKHFATGKWCPKCGVIFPKGSWPAAFCSCGAEVSPTKPPLWERWPAAKPERLACDQRVGEVMWVLKGTRDLDMVVSVDLAASLCMQWVVKAVRKMKGTVTFGGSRDAEIVIMSLTGREAAEGISPHLPEAVAIAKHRLLDAVEAKG